MTPDPAPEILRCWLSADQLLTRLERELRADGAAFDDIDQRLINELGISASDWHSYHAVRRAADRYQHTTIPDKGAPID